jgi:hypothetical protein
VSKAGAYPSGGPDTLDLTLKYKTRVNVSGLGKRTSLQMLNYLQKILRNKALVFSIIKKKFIPRTQGFSVGMISIFGFEFQQNNGTQDNDIQHNDTCPTDTLHIGT